MTFERHITWENFERDTVRAEVPAIHPIAGSPEIAMFFQPSPAQIGISIALPILRLVRPSPYKEIDIVARSSGKGPALVVSTSNTVIFRQVFPVLLEIADAIQLEGSDPFEAVEVAVRRIASAIRLNPGLSDEETIGLWGELWVLQKLLSAKGKGAIRNWYGWKKDRHDFRVGPLELEVKSTLGTSATHVISSIGQLASTDGYDLYLVSIQLSRSANGESLSTRVKAVKSELPAASPEFQHFSDALRDIGASPAALAISTESYSLRQAPVLIPMTADLPQLTSKSLLCAVGPAAIGRVKSLQYEVNVDGLGHGPETDLFERAVPWMKQL